MTSIERITNLLWRRPVDRIGLYEHFGGDIRKVWQRDVHIAGGKDLADHFAGDHPQVGGVENSVSCGMFEGTETQTIMEGGAVKRVVVGGVLGELPVAELKVFLKPVTDRLPEKRLRWVTRLAVQGILAAQSPLVTKMARLLESRHGTKLSPKTVRLILRRRGVWGDPPGNKRAVRRFERSKPNDLWQADLVEKEPTAIGAVYGVPILDDHSRYLVGLRFFPSKGAESVLLTTYLAMAENGTPAEILCDRGGQFVDATGEGTTHF